MRVAIVYNRESQRVINLFGVPNQEKLGLKTIQRLEDALREGGHRVVAFEGDKELVHRLEDFMPRVVKGERPGLVFNVSYGIQGQARYTHVPSILEMVGIPYVASGPLAHSLALDKVVAKIIFRQQGLPTPDFVVLESPDVQNLDLEYPQIVKPRHEAVSFGLRVVNNDAELAEAVQVIWDRFRQPILVEQYIPGREVNVGILGNNPPEALPPVLLDFGSEGPDIYTYEDKTGKSGRTIGLLCPAPIDEKTTTRAQELAVRAFRSLGCADCARVDMRLDDDGKLYLLEINSLPSLGQRGSYVRAAEEVGLDFNKLVNRLVEEASARYFGTPHPPRIVSRGADPKSVVFSYLTENRERAELRLREWVDLSSRTADIVGLREAMRQLDRLFQDLGMQPVPGFEEETPARLWQSKQGLAGGTLLVGHVDVPLDAATAHQPYRRDPERIHGDGVGSSRAPLVALEFALRALRRARRLSRIPLGVLYYTDEGRDCQYSRELIQQAAAQAKRVLVMRPGNPEHFVVTQRRGHRRFRLTVEGSPLRPGRVHKRPETLRWATGKLEELAALSARKEGLSVSTLSISTQTYPLLLPHRVTATVLLTYIEKAKADRCERQMREILGRRGPKWELRTLADRPAMKERRANLRLAQELKATAADWEIPLSRESSLWPSAAGLVHHPTAVVCGLGPVATDLYTPQEAVQRISLIQRTLLLAQFLLRYSSAGGDRSQA